MSCQEDIQVFFIHSLYNTATIKNITFFLLLCLSVYYVYTFQQNGSLSLIHITQQFQKLTPVPVPSPDIAALAKKAGMTDKAKDIFYRTKPEIVDDRATFEKDCKAPVSTNTVELGCYTSANKIYLLNIANPQITDEMVVTASHEMLHAAYEQLTTSEKATVGAGLEHDVPFLEDKSLTRELHAYQHTEPGERDNELHSILGTEYTPLNSSLETYYARYFTHRQTVVTYATNFNSVFSNLEGELTALSTSIHQLRLTMRQDVRRDDIEGYNALVPQVNNLVQEYNTDVDEYNQLSRSLRGQEAAASDQ